MAEALAINTPNWLPLEEVCNLLNLSEKTVKNKCRNSEFNYKVEKKNKKCFYFISFNSLPEYYQNIYLYDESDAEPQTAYSDSPKWAKAQADKYLYIVKATRTLRGKELFEYIDNWNSENPDLSTTYSSVMRMRQRYKDNGLSGLLAKYGTTKLSKIADEYFDYFKNLYLVEGSPSLRSCWDSTLGYAMRCDNSINKYNFPCDRTFLRKLEKEVPKQAIYRARKGASAWNRKYGGYINRDYSNITCGKVWVSDHAQIDIACFDENNNVVFPWVTAWRDYKSGKWLGWYLQTGSPNSDHIFQTFYYAAEKYGLPDDVIIDNGKDYRCKDFAGGRRKIKIDSNVSRTTSMLDELNVGVNFALPYNAQTKPIERDFLKIKELLSKHCVGYRGGNVVERPEVLADKIKQGTIMNFADLKKVFDNFIINIFNKRPSQGKNLNGMCPDELFNKEYQEKVFIPHDALKLFCMRTSRNFTVGRNGIQDRQLGITYWSDWMIANTGLKVYLRRDPENYKEAWAFKVENEEFVGTVTAVEAVAALYADKVSKEEFKTAMAIKKRNIKVTKSYIQQTREIDIAEQCENYMAAYSQVIKESNPRVTKVANTNMEKAVLKKKEMDEYGKQDLSALLSVTKPQKERRIFLFETDKLLAEAEEKMKGVVVNG